MNEIELSIKSTYLPEWGLKEGIRELIQNAKDGDTDGYPMKIYRSNVKNIRVENSGISLEHKALLFGHTTKLDRKDQIGQFGEGLKLGILAIVRSGRAVRVFSGNEIWVPKIKKSKCFGEDVLVFEIRPNIGKVNSIIVEIEIGIGEWQEMQQQFLFLCENVKELVTESYGSVVLNKEFAGKIFVKGIFVSEQPNFRYGYNLYNIQVDRNRQMVRDYDLNSSIFDIWNLLSFSDVKYFKSYAELVESEYDDLKHMEHNWFSLGDKFSEYLAKRFFGGNGPNTVPVLYDSDVKDLSHYGIRGVVLSNRKLVKAIWKHTGEPADIKRKMVSSVDTTYRFDQLTQEERKNFVSACIFVENGTKGEHLLREKVNIVDFKFLMNRGQFRDGEIYIARSQLSDFTKTLSVLVHEVAHFYGSDGESTHMAAIQDIYSNIIKNLME
jgi:hypothetical protein